MWPWIAALGALGGYVLLTSKTASAATGSSPAASPGQIAQGLQANPSGLAPGFQGQVAPGTPAPTYPSPTPQMPLPTFPDPSPYNPYAPTVDAGGGNPYLPQVGPSGQVWPQFPSGTGTTSGW